MVPVGSPPLHPSPGSRFSCGGMWCRFFITHFLAPLSPLPLFLFSPSFSSFLFLLAIWTSLPLDCVSVCMGPGTIRKAQNLLKQYSQHGLDGKKGGSNLTPLEGKGPLYSLRCRSSPTTSVHWCHSSFAPLVQTICLLFWLLTTDAQEQFRNHSSCCMYPMRE